MARKRELAPHVIEVKLEEQPPSEPSDGEEEISQDEEEEDDDDDEDEDEDDEAEDEDEDEDESEEEEDENIEVEDEEQEEDFSSKESIRKLLEPFGKEQLMEIFKDAIVKNPSLLSRIDEPETDPVHRQIFVHDLDWDATSETLAAAFSPFGQIENCRVVMNKSTGRCKGYGFVLFRTRAAAKRAIKDPLKIIGDRVAKCRLAFPGYAAAAGKAPGPATVLGPKIRVGLLNPAAGLSPAFSGGVAGVSYQPYTVRPVGSASRGSVVSVNSISPSVIGNYGFQAALHGLGAYQNSAPSAATRPQTGVGSWGASGLAPRISFK